MYGHYKSKCMGITNVMYGSYKSKCMGTTNEMYGQYKQNVLWSQAKYMVTTDLGINNFLPWVDHVTVYISHQNFLF